MVFDAPYDHLLRLLSNRTIAWLRDQIRTLPARLSPEDELTPVLALAARMAPVLSGWRGAPSPLESITAERFDAALTARITTLVWRGGMDPDRVAPLLAAGRHVKDQPLWQLSRQHLALHPPCDLAERLDLTDDPDANLVAETEAFLCRPVAADHLTELHIDLFYRVLTQLYHFGESRPRTIAPRVFGQAFENCLRFSEWAVGNKNLTALVQMITCLRLIDPDHDVSALLSEVIPYQRPDGSFPARCGWSDQPQDLAAGAIPTIMAMVAFHVISHRRWHGPHAPDRHAPPIHTCRDQIAARIAERLEQAGTMPLSERLFVAASISRATGRNGFLLLEGLGGYVPTRGEVQALAVRLAGFPIAAQYARRTLALTQPLQELIDALSPEGGPLLDALRWLRAPTARIASPSPEDFIHDWDHAARQGDEPGFLRHCEQAAQYGLHDNSPHIREMAVHLVQREQRAFLARPRASLPELLRRLDLMALMALVFEPEPELAAAA